MILRLLLALAVSLSLAACGMESPPGPVVSDSAGVRIVTHPTAREGDAPLWTAPSEPATRIGIVEGSPEQQLFRVRDATRMSDGRIAVLNMGTQEVRFYGPDGSYMGAFGREGAGPGEFRLPNRLTRLPGDTLVVTDASLRRVSWFDSAGAFLRSRELDMSRLLSALPPGHGSHGGEYVPGDRVLADVFKGGLGPVGRVHRPEFGFMLAPLSLSEIDTVVLYRGGEQMRPEEGAPSAMAYFYRDTHWTFGGDPVRIYVGDNAAYDIQVLSETGEQVMRIRREGERRPVTAADLERWRTAELEWAGTLGEERLAAARRSQAALPEPETMPTHGRLYVDTEGNLWVEEYRTTWESTRRYAVYDPDGLLLARAELPPGLDPLEIGPDYVLGLRRDELDVEFVEAYALRRGGGGTVR